MNKYRIRAAFAAAFAILAATSAPADDATIRVDARGPGRALSPYLTGACIEDVNHEIYGGIYSQMIFGESFAEPASDRAEGISAMWGPVRRGTAELAAKSEADKPFAGAQSQRLAFAGGAGEVGIENQGLKRWGMSFLAGKGLEGYLWLRAEKPVEVFVALENRDGSRRYASARLAVGGNEWRRYDFALTPDATDPAGRFTVTLHAAGSVVVGHAFLQPGEWGRFKGLPVRRDVAEGLIEQGVTVLRYGGSMVNAPEYRWKKMIGPRDRRPPYKGTWYPYSSNGWGIVDFLDFCEAAGFLGVPDFNIDETPQEMADFVEYANGPADSEWGRRRAADGHRRPYALRYIELGNEEKIDDAYFAKFAAIAKAVWAKDSQITLVVGDFAYDAPINDPMRVTGANSRITSLAGQRKILDLARQSGREVWFDVHVWTEAPEPSPSMRALPSYVTAIDQIAGGAKHRVAVFELNSNSHRQGRALSNARAIGAAQRDGRIPVVTSANCLQCDGHNDNGWDQGLLFLNPAKVWLQPPGYVTRMIRRGAQARVLEARLAGAAGKLDVTATRSEDGKILALQVVNPGNEPVAVLIQFDGYSPSQPTADSEVMAGALDARNTAESPEAIKPMQAKWQHETEGGATHFTFAPHSFTVLRFK